MKRKRVELDEVAEIVFDALPYYDGDSRSAKQLILDECEPFKEHEITDVSEKPSETVIRCERTTSRLAALETLISRGPNHVRLGAIQLERMAESLEESNSQLKSALNDLNDRRREAHRNEFGAELSRLSKKWGQTTYTVLRLRSELL